MNNYINCRNLKDNVLVWYRDDNNVRQTKLYPGVFEFFTPHPAGKYVSIYGEKLIKHEFQSRWNMQSALEPFQHKNILAYESDINSELKLLANTYFGVDAPKLNYCMLDIEVDYDPKLGFSTIDNPYAPINAVAIYLAWIDKSIVIAVPPESWDKKNKLITLAEETNTEIILVDTEKELLELFLDSIDDSDCLSGWNSEMFDIPYIARRIEIALGRSSLQRLCFPEASPPSYEEVEKFGNKNTVVKLNGRIHWDYMELFKKFEMEGRPSYSLEAISNEILPDLAKLEYDGTLASLYNNDFEHFIRYNIRDTHVLRGFEQKLGYLELANDFYHSACGLPQHVFGTLKLADLSFINYCHYTLDKKVPDWDQFKIDGNIHGAMVLTPQIGLHNMIGSVDINSLYPSAIRCINISAETLIGQMDGTYSNDDRKMHTAWKAVYDGSEENVTIVYNKFAKGYSGSETHSAMDWKHILLERKWAISGSGTIFRQDEQGMIPAVLTEWFALRKKYKKLMEGAQELYEQLSAIEHPTLEQIEARSKAYQEFSFNHRRQYVYKIKLNSAYGALSNYRFRFFDLSLGQSTTGTGRAILEHMCSEIARNLDGKYDMFSSSIAYGDSVGAKSLVYTGSTNAIEIETLFKHVDNVVGTKEYYHPNGLNILTYDQSTNTTCYRNVKYVMRHKANKKMFRVWLTNSTYIDVTEDHSLMGYVNTSKRTKSRPSCITEVKPEELGDISGIRNLIFLKNLPQHNIKSKMLHPLIYQLLGLMVGDGGATWRSSGIDISVGSRDMEQMVQKLFLPLQQEGIITSYHIMKNGHDIKLCGTVMFDLCRSLLYVEDMKVVPDWLQYEHIDNIRLFLRGYFTADGGVTGTRIRLSSVRLDNIIRVQKLLFLCGISSNYFTESTINSFKGRSSGTQTSCLVVKGTKKFKSDIGFILDRKMDAIPNPGWKDVFASTYDFDLSSIARVEEISYDDYVYDIEVDDTHTFFANNVLVHNTDSCYFKTNAELISIEGLTTQQIEDYAIKIADKVGQKVNESFDDFCERAFCVRPEFNGIMKCAREIVAKRGIFVTKKRYVLKLIDLDGYRTDKLKAMGLEMKKTTTPKHVQKFLAETMNMILNGEATWDEIDEFIVDYRTQLMSSPNIMQLGLPKGIQKLEHYTDMYKIDKKTRLPGHVAASICYNECLKLYGDTENSPIVSGNKIKVFYIMDKVGRFTSVAIPTDNANVPWWFTENFTLDVKKHEVRLIDNNLEKIFTAIGRQVPTKQTIFNNELFIW